MRRRKMRSHIRAEARFDLGEEFPRLTTDFSLEFAPQP